LNIIINIRGGDTTTLTKTDVCMIKEIGASIGRIAGRRIRDNVMQGSDKLRSSSDIVDVAKWLEHAMNRLDQEVDESMRIKIMENCGNMCCEGYREVVESAKMRRSNYGSVDEFLAGEQRHPPRGTRLEKKGDILLQIYAPETFIIPARCYCSLLRGLPSDDEMSRTYCHCAEGFVKSYWQEVLGRPLKVELLQSAISGAQDCRFAIHLM
jgi:hypothetical protein